MATTKTKTKAKSTKKKTSRRSAPARAAVNAIDLLKEDHDRVKDLLDKLEGTSERAQKRRIELLEKIALELRVHARIEEEIFYPAFREAGEKKEDEKMFFEALEEHRAAVELVLPDLEGTTPESETFSGRAKVLKELITHHIDEEEKELFPRARKLLGKQRLDELGSEVEERKMQLERDLG